MDKQSAGCGPGGQEGRTSSSPRAVGECQSISWGTAASPRRTAPGPADESPVRARVRSEALWVWGGGRPAGRRNVLGDGKSFVLLVVAVGGHGLFAEMQPPDT